MPQTAASLADRKKALETLARRFPAVASQWLQESVAEMEDGEFDYQKREDAVRNARVGELEPLFPC